METVTGKESDNGIWQLHQYPVRAHHTYPNRLELLHFLTTAHIFHSHQTSTQEAMNVLQVSLQEADTLVVQ